MNRKASIIFAVLIVLLALLNMTHGAPQSMNVWEFFGWLTGRSS